MLMSLEPDNRHHWMKIIDNKLQDKYENEYNHFIKENGSLLFNMFKYNKNYVTNSKKSCCGIIEFIEILFCNNDINANYGKIII